MSIVIIVIYRIVPECMDLPYCLNNEFCYIEGESQSHSDKSACGGHSVSIKDEDSGEKIMHISTTSWETRRLSRSGGGT